MSKILTLYQMSRMTTEQITQAYREGYMLEDNIDKLNINEMEYPDHERKFGFMNSVRNTISLAAGSCPADILQGAVKTLSVALSTPTVGPYVVRFYADGVLKYTSAATSTFPHTFSNTFGETAGSHTYGAEVTDSCPTSQGGPKTSTRSACTLNILAPCATPDVTLTIPP